MPGETPTRLVPEQASRPIAPPSPPSGAAARFGGAPSPDDWEALSTIGEGGMGLVLLARDKRLGRLVALKRLKPECRADPAVRARFLREARAQAALASSHVVHIYAIGEDADGPWLAMEYVASALPPPSPGAPNPPQTLEQKISADGVMRPREALSMALRIGRAMEQAHAAGVVHRDLKPANILIDQAGEPKVADFGLARIERGAGGGGSSVAAALTVSGEKLLSLGYGAPEQEIDASRCDARTDVYGLGAILFFCLAGRNPRFFREDDLPVFLRPLLAKALATDPSRRHQTAAAFDAEAAALLADAKSAVPTVRTTWRCKWCGTVNPLEKRFCDGCGWDGMAHCLECNAEMRFGIQFCGVCGANQAAYETAANNLARIEKACAARDFPHAVALAAAPLALEPSGPAGSRLLARIRERGAEARRAVERRDRLREIIPMEMQARNYERAELFMDEMDGLSSAPEDDHSKERRDMPALRETRDLARIERALRERDRALAERLLASLPSATPEGRVRADRARAALRRRARVLRAARAAGFAALLAVVFLVATPAAMLVSGPGPSPAWAPYLAVASLPRVGGVAAAWAAIWGVEDLSAYESKAK